MNKRCDFYIDAMQFAYWGLELTWFALLVHFVSPWWLVWQLQFTSLYFTFRRNFKRALYMNLIKEPFEVLLSPIPPIEEFLSASGFLVSSLLDFHYIVMWLFYDFRSICLFSNKLLIVIRFKYNTIQVKYLGYNCILVILNT